MAERKPASAQKKKAPGAPRARVDKSDGEAAVREKIAAMPEPFRAMGERLHALILRSAPALRPTLHYGMPWYAKDGQRICFFHADKLLTFGLTEAARFDAPAKLRASAWYVYELDEAVEAEIAAIVKQAAS